jgi:DNA-binding CsgD family transcriptional regulator
MASTSLDDDELLLAFHDAALEPSLWPSALGRAAALLQARGALLLARFVPPEPRPMSGRLHGISAEFAAAYTTRLYQCDPVLPGATPLPPGSVFHLRDFFPSEAALRQARIVREWMAPQGFDDLMGVVLAPGQPYANMLLAFAGREGFAPGARERLARWAPHLQRAVRALRRLESAGSERALLRDVVDRLGSGLVIVGQSGRVLMTNQTADRMLQARDGLSVRDGRLHAANAADRERLWAALDEVMVQGRETSVSLPRPSGSPPLTMLAVPIETPDKMGSGELEVAVLFIQDPLDAPPLAPADLQVMFGLTAGQAELAALLARGHALDEISGRLGLTLNTVRTRVKQVFERTGTSSQTELVRRLVLSAAGLRRRSAAPQ